jgi:hypothetical protein
MSEIFESKADSAKKTVFEFGAQAKEKLLTQVRQEPVKAVSIVFAGSILISFLLGYYISRTEQESRRQRLMEDSMREVTNWIRQHGRRLATPIKEGLEATRSAVEEVAHSGAGVGRHLQPLLEKQKRSFLNRF